jgi:hypothetical protein
MRGHVPNIAYVRSGGLQGCHGAADTGMLVFSIFERLCLLYQQYFPLRIDEQGRFGL